MPTENYWMYSNLNERFENKSSSFKVLFKPRHVEKMTFEQAVTDSALKIANRHDRLFLSLSGGMDSEFIMILLHSLKIRVEPIIVRYEVNEKESDFALALCKNLNIRPIVLTLTEDTLFNIYLRKIYSPIGGIGLAATPLILTKHYALQNKGTLISGEHVIDDDPFLTKASIAEWDFYLDVLYKDIDSVGLLNYTPEIMRSIVERFDGGEVQEFKQNLYRILLRPKQKPALTRNILSRYRRTVRDRPQTEPVFIIGSKIDTLAMLDSW